MSTTFNVYSFSLSNSAPQLIKDIRRLDTPTSFEPKWGRVYCCCDGLFFIGVWRELDEGRHPSLLLLWNPSTGESVKLPTQYPQSSPKQHLYGIGYDPTSDDYKIIRIDWNKNVPDEILALKSGSWRKIGEYAGGINGVHWTSPMKLCLAFVEGAFHWLSREKDCVVSFNIWNEIYGEIPLPVTPYSNRIEEKRVSAVGRRVYYHHDDEINFNLWVMKDYGMKESWTKLFSIQSHGEGIMAPIYRFSNDEVLLSCYGLKGSIYKTSNGSSNRTWPLHLNDISDLKRTIDGFVYTEIEKREIAMDLLQQPNEDGSNNAAKLVEKREIAVVQATGSIENNRYGICKEVNIEICAMDCRKRDFSQIQTIKVKQLEDKMAHIRELDKQISAKVEKLKKMDKENTTLKRQLQKAEEEIAKLKRTKKRKYLFCQLLLITQNITTGGHSKEPPPLPPPPYPQPPPPYPQPNHRHPTASTSNTNMPPNHPKPPPYYNQNIPNSYYWLLPPQPQGFYGPPYPQQFHRKETMEILPKMSNPLRFAGEY
ncbi:putative mitochondrial chaperone BCS1-B-like [Capsicum annuum]|nr:putative mitochondrial chaperone BCS1-B-like [Capsicum annuum]